MNSQSSSPLRAAQIGIVIISMLCLGFSTAGSIIGSVKDAEGKPAVNVPVKLVAKGKTSGPTPIRPGMSPTGDVWIGGDEPVRLGSGDRVVQETKTDATGRFTFTNVSPGVYEIAAGSGNRTAISTVNIKDGVDVPAVAMTLPK